MADKPKEVKVVAAEPKAATVPDQLKAGFKAGTNARAGTKAVARNAKTWATGFVGLLLTIGFIWFTVPWVMEDGPKFGSTSQSDDRKIASPSWGDDGKIRVGVWSEPLRPAVGCTIHFSAGNGTTYKVQTRILGGEWTDHTPRTKVVGDEARFMVIKADAPVPARISC
jgi:hypothetical protein